MRHLSPKELRSLAAHCGGAALLLFFALFIGQGGLERTAGALVSVAPSSQTASLFGGCGFLGLGGCGGSVNMNNVSYLSASPNPVVYNTPTVISWGAVTNGNAPNTACFLGGGQFGDLALYPEGNWVQIISSGGSMGTANLTQSTMYGIWCHNYYATYETGTNIMTVTVAVCPAGQTRSGNTCVSSVPTAPQYLFGGTCVVGSPMGFNWGTSNNATSYAFRVDNTVTTCGGVTGGNNNVGCVSPTDYVEDNINRGEQTITILNPGAHRAWVHGVGPGGWSPATSYSFGCGCPAGQIQSGGRCVTRVVTPSPPCSNGLNRASYPSCACPSGQIQSGSSCYTPAPTAPSCSITPSPTSVTSPGSVMLNYTVSNATAASITCTQNGGGTCPTPPAITPSSGSISSGTLTNSTASAKTVTYTIFCSGAGSQSNATNVVVNPVAAPASCPANCPGSAAPNCTANAGYTYNSGPNTCTAIACPAHCPGAGAGSCTANSGYTYNSSNNTCTAVAAPICANNLDYSLYGPSCTCPANQVQSGSGCVAASCPNGLNITAYPLCACPSGQVQSGSTCINDIVQTGLSLTATPSRVHRGGSTTLTWSSNIGDTSCALTSSATGTTLSTLLSGTLTQTITRRTTFTLTCNSGNLRQSVSILPSFIEI